MEITKYTEYVLRKGQSIRIMIANFYGFNENQMQQLRDAGCDWSNELGWNFAASSMKEFKKVASKLKGFDFGGFVSNE